MKRSVILTVCSFLLLFCLSGCYLVNSVFFNEEDKALVGLWRSSGWNDVSGNCYWDFRADGRVFITEWTDDVETKLIPTHFNYYVDNEGYLRLSQYLGIASFKFEIAGYSDFDAGYCYLWPNDFSGTFDFDRIDYSTEFMLTKQFDYSDEARAVRALYEEALNE